MFRVITSISNTIVALFGTVERAVNIADRELLAIEQEQIVRLEKEAREFKKQLEEA